MPELSHQQLLSKLKSIRGLKELIHPALLLYVLVMDGDIPTWVKALAVTALIYLIDPIDTIPDITPVVGYVDDLLILTAAIKKLSDHIQPHHEQQAEDMQN